MFDIEEELKKLPAKPGVYLMHDEKDAIIYVGKAVSLKNRVRQYFQSSRNKGVKIEQMVTHIARFEYIVTDSELEALVLECNLIKEHRPKYNTMLMDDKTYPYIKVTVGEDFPRVLFSRRLKKDKAKYYGPYTSAGAVKDTIDLIHKLYQIRTCSRSLPRDIGKERPCLNYHIHQCAAPCQGYITKEQYAENVGKALEFLNGNYSPLLKELEEKMKAASDAMEFEKAIEYRGAFGQRKADRPEAEDHQQRYGGQGHHRPGCGRRGCGGAGILRPGRAAHRPGPFLSEDHGRGAGKGDSGQLHQAVLRGHALYPAGADDSGGGRPIRSSSSSG